MFQGKKRCYRNPDAPLGYVNEAKLEVVYKEGAEIDGVHCRLFGYFDNSDIFELEDCSYLSGLDIDDSPDEEGEILSASPKKVIIKKEVTINQEVTSKKEVTGKNDVAIKKEVASKKEATGKKDVTIKKEVLNNYDDKVKEERVRSRKKDNDDSRRTSSKKNIKKEFDEKYKPKIKPKAYYREDSDGSIDNDSPRHSKYRRSMKRYSSSPSPECVEVSKIKAEILEDPNNLHGSYTCEVCHITMNTLKTYSNHLTGKRHLKGLKAKNLTATVAQTIPMTLPEGQTKYPRIAAGISRIKIKARATIQDLVETQVRTPCPGLHKVIEIQGIAEVQYYCSLCDVACSQSSIIPHLKGHRHQLNSVKYYAPDALSKMDYKSKYKNEKEILMILSSVQRREGLGEISVEREELTSTGFSGSHSSSRMDVPSTSSMQPVADFPNYYDNTSVPDISSSDFYCPICKAHMNSQQSWETHVIGKRHLTNLKKAPGTIPSRTRTVEVPDAEPFLFRILRNVTEPIVGLDRIQEVRIPETNSETYHCFPCGAYVTSLDIVQHLVGLKHRKKYLEDIDHPNLKVLTSLKEPAISCIVEQMCSQVEEERGRGRPRVHITKSAVI